MTRKLGGGLLGLLILGLLVFVSCGAPGQGSDEPPPLDDAARRACGLYAPVAEDVRDGRLVGPELFRQLQDVFDQAQQSQTEGFRIEVQQLYTTAINADAQQKDPLPPSPATAAEELAQRAAALRVRCAAG